MVEHGSDFRKVWIELRCIVDIPFGKFDKNWQNGGQKPDFTLFFKIKFS